MKFLHGGQIRRLAIDQIEVRGRLRSVRTEFVENLMVMAEDTGITTPIHVRKTQGQYVLIDGAHRLEAARRLGLADIAALVVECRAEEARAMEATNNLGAARMTPLQTAVFFASWKRDYYTMHPERKPGVFKGNQFTGDLVERIMPLTKTIANAFGINEATVKRALAAGDRLTAEEASRLESAQRRITMKDLRDLAKISDAQERSAIVDSLASGSAKSVTSLRRQIDTESNIAPPPIQLSEQAYTTLLRVWRRAPTAAKRRLIRECASEVEKLRCNEKLT